MIKYKFRIKHEKMVNHDFDDTLLRILEKEAQKEKWRKKLRIKGIVIKKKTTKRGSFMFTVKTAKSEYNIVVPKHRRDEFELAKNIYEGDHIKAEGDRNISVIFCDRIKKLNKTLKFNEKQSKLAVQ